MKLLVDRNIKTKKSTIGTLTVNGGFECYTLEPVDRGLTSAMTLEVINDVKIPGKTAIPTGTYKIGRYESPKHHTVVPILIDVPGFGFVEIHVGNFPADTLACLLPGTEKGIDQVLHSKVATDKLYEKIFKALDEDEEVTITYQ